MWINKNLVHQVGDQTKVFHSYLYTFCHPVVTVLFIRLQFFFSVLCNIPFCTVWKSQVSLSRNPVFYIHAIFPDVVFVDTIVLWVYLFSSFVVMQFILAQAIIRSSLLQPKTDTDSILRCKLVHTCARFCHRRRCDCLSAVRCIAVLTCNVQNKKEC